MKSERSRFPPPAASTTRSASGELLRNLPAFDAAAPVKLLAASPQAVMVIHCIDVGQADATLVEFPCGVVLVDAGAQDADAVTDLVNYLERFFLGRPDLNRTIQAIIITHNHIDHTRALREVVQRFNVLRYIDNGQLDGSGATDPRWVRANAQAGGRNISISEIAQGQIAALLPARNGLTGAAIDPLSCDLCDPSIVILSARHDQNPGWPEGDFDNKNNHSLVIRVDLGQSSALFTGDLETSAIEALLQAYAGTSMLDVDLWHVGHHGSHNATTAALLDALTLKAAVISVGKWDYGLNKRGGFYTFHFGHPRAVTVELLARKITRNRSQSGTFKVAERPSRFHDLKVRKAIYATGWDGTVKFFATPTGTIRVTRHN